MKLFGCAKAVVVGLGIASSTGWAAAAVPPKRLVEVTDLSSPVVSPDGRWVAFRAEQASVERNTYDSAWYVQDLQGGVLPRRVGDGGVPIFEGSGGSNPEPASWSPDGRYLYYRAMLEGRTEVWRAAADGSGAEAVTSDAADVRSFSLSLDGKRLRYSIGATREEVRRAEQAEYDQGIHIGKMVPVGAPLFRSSFIGGKRQTQRFTGVGWVRGALLLERPDRWREVDLHSRTVRDLAAKDLDPESATGASASDRASKSLLIAQEPGGRRVAMVTPVQGDGTANLSLADLASRYQLSVRPLATSQEAIVCRHELCAGQRITSVQWRPESDEVLFTTTVRQRGNTQSVLRWNVISGKVQRVASLPGLMGGGRFADSVCGLSSEALACVVAEASIPPRIERVDIDTGQRRVLFEPNASLAGDLDATLTSRLLIWKDQNGQEFSGYLFSGKKFTGARRPLFVNFYYCSGFLRGGMGDEWPLASLAESGVSALCINSPHFETDPVVRFDAAKTAVESVVALLDKQGEVDPTKVGMGGLSHGSETALWVGVESDVLAAVSISTPTVSPLWFLIGGLKGDMFYPPARQNWGLGSVEETPEQWRRISVAYNWQRIRAPVLFQMSEEEYLYGLDYTIPMIQQQRADLYVFPDEQHQKFQPRHKAAVYERNLDWFKFWLLGAESADPSKAAQYARWRSIKKGMGQGTTHRPGTVPDPAAAQEKNSG